MAPFITVSSEPATAGIQYGVSLRRKQSWSTQGRDYWWPACAGHDEFGGISRPRLGALHELGAQRLAPVRRRRDFLLVDQDLRLFLHIGLQVGGKLGVDFDGGERLAERIGRHVVTL